MKRLLSVVVAVALLAASGTAAAIGNAIKIAHIYAKIGSLASNGRELQRGLELGFEYATGGTDRVLGRKIDIIQMDTRGEVARTRALFQEAYGKQGAALAVGPVSSELGLIALSIAKQYRKIIIPEGMTNAITGRDWNRYVVRIGRNVSQGAVAQAISLGGKGVCAATVTQNSRLGWDEDAVFERVLRAMGGKVVDEEFLSSKAVDFDVRIKKAVTALRASEHCGNKKYVFVIWRRGKNPFAVLSALDPQRYGIQFASGGATLAAVGLSHWAVGLQGGTYYYYRFPDNDVNTWLVKRHFQRYNSPPDAFTAQGFAEAQAIVAAIERAGSTDTEQLIKAFEGLQFISPKGPVYIRPQDHQALQNMYHFKVVLNTEASTSGDVTFKLLKVIRAGQMDVPILNEH